MPGIANYDHVPDIDSAYRSNPSIVPGLVYTMSNTRSCIRGNANQC